MSAPQQSLTARRGAGAASPSRGHRWAAPRSLTACLAGYVAAYAVFAIAGWGSASTRSLIYAAAAVPLGLLAVGAMLLARRRTVDGRSRTAWGRLAVALFCLSIGFAATVWYQATAGAVPFPSAVDACYLLFYPAFILGLLSFPTSPQSSAGRTRMIIDAATVAVSAVSVVWFLVIGPTLVEGHHSVLSGIVACAYPVGDVLQLFAAAYIALRTPAAATRRALALLMFGLATVVASDVINSWLVLHAKYSQIVVVQTGFLTGLALYCLAASSRPTAEPAHPSAGEVTEVVPRTRRARSVPYLAPIVVLGMSIGAQFGAPMYQRVGLAICAAAVAGLVLLRQWLAQRDLLDAQGQLSHRALHDALTGLPNRVLVLDRAEQLLARARRAMRPAAALYVDVDGFKQVNDTFGHAAGDELLRAVAARLSSVVRESDTVGRMGGDEFVVLLDSSTLDAGPELVAERLLEVLRQPLELDAVGGRRVMISASVGIAVGEQTTADDLLRDADMALYAAKEAGKDRFAVFESSMQTAAQDRLLLEMDLREAVDAGQLFLLYQPTFDLQTETVRGVEALVRWRHPTRGIITPDLFIGLAEEAGVIVPIGRWVVREACREAAEWHAAGRAIGMSVNVSGRQLDEDVIVDDVRQALADSGLDPGALTLEVTETALMRDPDATARRLRSLKELGVRIAIDDFGTGYSSMAYLRQFPVDALKIDRAFISGIAASKESAALVHTLVQLGKTLDLETLGEGIEEPAQLRNLQHEQCDSGQGFLFARPLPPDDVMRFLDEAASTIASARSSD